MKTQTILAAAAFLLPALAQADIIVNLPKNSTQKEYTVQAMLISNAVKPRAERGNGTSINVTPEKGRLVMKQIPGGPAQYLLPVAENEYVVVYASPEDNITLNITDLAPLKYTASGSALMKDVATLDSESGAILKEFQKLQNAGTVTQETADSLQNAYNGIFLNYLAKNNDTPAAPFALMHLEGEEFIKGYDALGPEAKKSILMPLVHKQKEYVDKSIEMEKRKEAMQNGTMTAPDFTFPDMQGKKVSLKDFRGKWVIIDFWGSWCPWCIKGFPELKKIYTEYAGKLEIVGVACNDTPEAWKGAVGKWQLPWVNLYNGEANGGKIVEEYAVEGFPTKVIVNPEGKIANITTGADPAFPDTLAKLLNAK